MLFTHCIYASPLFSDGTRISVMSRHTLSDGKTPDLNITSESYDLWLPQLAPLPSVVGKWYRKQIDWETFTFLYHQHIAWSQQKALAERLAFAALTEDITLLCVEPEHFLCHRSLLATFCQTLAPSLEVEHRIPNKVL